MQEITNYIIKSKQSTKRFLYKVHLHTLCYLAITYSFVYAINKIEKKILVKYSLVIKLIFHLSVFLGCFFSIH